MYSSSALRRLAIRSCISLLTEGGSRYIDLVRNTSTSGTHTTTSNGESPDQTSEWVANNELSSAGIWMLRLIRRCMQSSLPTMVSMVERARRK